ncbi:MAG: SOS response-associated peptidase [Steroidobacteraceae bacterium]
MCDRYVTPESAHAEREFGVAHAWWKFSPSFNVHPSRNVPVVRMDAGEIEGVMLHWGLIPDWAGGDAAKACADYVSAESVEHCAVTSAAWERARRCIVPMFGFYVWQLTWERHRQPFFVRLVNRSVFAVAALWDRTVTEEGDDVIESCALVTVPPNPLVAELQGAPAQMPAILDRRDYTAWLSASSAAAKLMLRSCPQEQMIAHPVSPRVNSLKHDDAQLIRAVEIERRGGLRA